MPDVATKWMTYGEMAEALGIGRESARQLVIRKKWPRQKGNDGRARVGVPEEALRPMAGSSTGNATRPDTSDEPSDATPPATSDDTPLVPDLLARLSAAQGELVEMARRLGMAEGEIVGLKAQADEIRRDRDRWHSEATARRSWWHRLAG